MSSSSSTSPVGTTVLCTKKGRSTLAVRPERKTQRYEATVAVLLVANIVDTRMVKAIWVLPYMK